MLAGKFIGAQGTSHPDVLGVVALDHHVTLADGIGFIVDLLAVKMHITGGPYLSFRVFDEVLRLSEHPTRTTGWVVDGDHRRQYILHRLKYEVCHQVNY